jgi:hypothetical protein
MERAGALGQPVGRSNGDLHSSTEAALGCAGRGVQLVTIRCSKYEEVDVAYWSISLFSGEPCCPGPVDIRSVNLVDTGECVAEHPRNAECLDEHVRQPNEVWAGRVGADESCSSDEPACDQAGSLGAFNLAVDGRIRDPGSLRELSQGVFDRRVAEDKRKQLGLLLRPEDR